MKLNRTTIILAAFAVTSLLVIAGCNKPQSTAPAPTTLALKTETPVAEGTFVAFRNDAGELVCPVLGDVIPSEEAAAGYQDYEGKRRYFCCAGCPEKFAADPEKYAK